MKVYLFPVSEENLTLLRNHIAELQRARKLLKVPLTSVATALDIDNQVGVALVELEQIPWAIDSKLVQVKEVPEQEAVDEDSIGMDHIPLVSETHIAPTMCNGCGKEAMFRIAFRSSPTSRQAMAWCLACAFDIMNFFEARVYDLKERPTK